MLVEQGQLLFSLFSPQLEHDAAQLRQSIDTLSRQIDVFSGQQEFVARAGLLLRERDAVRVQLAGIEAALAQFDLRAPFAGHVVELADPLRRLEWIERGEQLALVADLSTIIADTLVAEQFVRRIAVGANATIRFRNPDLKPLRAFVASVDTSALRSLPDPALSSTRGGPIPARDGENGKLIPESAVYRIRLVPSESMVMDRMELASVRIEAEAESLVARFWRHVWGIALRESGF
jgi:putative peptide zinc metalloprotease protein